MHLVRLLVPGSEKSKTPIKKLFVNKLLSTFILTMALGSVPINTARDLSEANNHSLNRDTAGPIHLGLSRRRGAFNKAIGMLATAADENERLADYYQGVTRRVRGDSADGEDTSGVDVVKVVHRNKHAPPAAWNPPPAASEAPQPQNPVSVQSLSVPTGTPERYSSADHYWNYQAEGQSVAQPEFTVGDMTFDTNPAIEQWVNYYSATPAGRSTMKIGIERSNAYLEMARAEFRSAGVPEDLVWLACVESVWNPRAVSPAAAGGIWQFIPATATDYGLTVQCGNDERADPLKQTRVAAAYLHDLYTIFGDWALAMAAYNSGEPRVMGAIVKNGNADFWELCEKGLLPKETRDYVPKILATIKLAGHADEYGFVSQEETAGPAGS